MTHGIFSTVFSTLYLTMNHVMDSVRVPFHLDMLQKLIAYFCQLSAKYHTVLANKALGIILTTLHESKKKLFLALSPKLILLTAASKSEGF
jgi:hypothetical protein